jgi:hypothetical protein
MWATATGKRPGHGLVQFSPVYIFSPVDWTHKHYLVLWQSTWHWRQCCSSCCPVLEHSLYDAQDIGTMKNFDFGQGTRIQVKVF